jgi:ADP-heptose:LPS heptosyltransferase
MKTLMETPPQTVLLKFPHGLGDAVSFRSVLRHLQKHRPQWTIDVAAHASFEKLFRGRIRHFQPILTADNIEHDRTQDVLWREGTGNHTKAVKCLLEEFKIEPEAQLLRYTFEPSDEAKGKVSEYLQTLPQKNGFVAIHSAGKQCPQKNLPIEAVAKLCKHFLHMEYVPILLDWSPDVPLADGQRIFCPGKGHILWDGQDLADPDVLTALLERMHLNVMVDSGPQKLALRPTRAACLCVWPTSNPIHYVDSPHNEIHLVPQDWAAYLEKSNGVDRQCDRQTAIAFFRANFRHYEYANLIDGLCFMSDYLLGKALNEVAPIEPTHEPIPETFVASATVPVAAPNARKLLLVTHICPGDIMTMTAAVEMLHQQYPGQFLTAVETSCMAIWENNPHITVPDNSFERVDMHYHMVNESGNRPVHFIQGYTEFLGDNLRIPLKLTMNRPQLYLSDEEKGWMNQVWEITGSNAPYWVINAGIKHDYTAKFYAGFQEVVNLLRSRVRFVQIGRSSDIHPRLNGVIDLVDKTSDRALFRLIYHAQGVLSGVSFPMHIAAAFEKPAVVVAGGREPRLWNSYPYQTLLSTTGSLDCCKNGGCWRSRVVKLNDGKDGNELCARPMPTVPYASGECMTRISPEFVAEAVKSFL